MPLCEGNTFEAWGSASANALQPESARKPERLEGEVGLRRVMIREQDRELGQLHILDLVGHWTAIS